MEGWGYRQANRCGGTTPGGGWSAQTCDSATT